jgi:PAS domain S-box-containing protein
VSVARHAGSSLSPSVPTDGGSDLWPHCKGETGTLLRSFDWSKTDLGPIARWPQNLRTAVDVVLCSPAPMVILWGHDGIMIYNDAYTSIAGTRHPQLFGSKVLEGWPELADFLPDVIERTLRGESLSFRDQAFVLDRHGRHEEAWFDLDYSPIPGESGLPAGVLAVVVETTERVRAEAALRASEERLRLITDALPGLIAFIDRDEVYRFANKSYEKWLGLDPRTVVGQTARELLGDAVYSLRKPYLARAFAGEHVVFETFLTRAYGTQRECEINYIPAEDPNGNITGIYIFVTDITERKRNETALRKLFECAPSFMAILHGPAHEFAFVNPAYLQLVGYRDIIGKPVREALPDIAGQGFFELLDRVYVTGRPYVGRSMPIHLNRTPDRTGEERFLDFVYHPITESDGTVTGIFVQGHDVTERLRAEQALRELNETLETQVAERTTQLLESQAQIRTFFEYSSEYFALLVATEDGRFRYEEANPAVLRAYGKTREQVIGHTLEEVLGAQEGAETGESLRKCLQSGKPHHYVRKRGAIIYDAVAAPVPSEASESCRLVVSGRDVSESRRLEEQLRQSQKMEAVGQLTGGIAHDFNNLLQGIIGSLNVVEKRISQGRGTDVARFIGGAMTAAQRAAALTHRLLAFSRRQPLDPKQVDVNELIASMEDLLRRTSGAAIDLVLTLDENIWLTRCDTNQLENALLNLSINARDAMPDGGTLTIETRNVVLDDEAASRRGGIKPGGYVCIRVRDTGAGMSPDVISRAFDPFFTTKPTGQGTGLGLSMVYGFARQSEGAATITSDLGKGTTVKLYLPRDLVPAVNDEIPSATPGEHESHEGETVLVVEDEAIVRGLIVEVLGELGYRVIEVADGPSALTILESDKHIDLLVTDIGLPGLNGRQVADAARVRRPGLKTLFMTGYAETAAGASGFLEPGMEMMTKPFAMDVLSKRIRDMIEG